jgi:hypothetical protein
MFVPLLAIALAACNALASPIDIEERLQRRLDTSSHCGQWECVPPFIPFWEPDLAQASLPSPDNAHDP